MTVAPDSIPSPQLGPGITLLTAFRPPIDAEVAEASKAELRRFVRALRTEFVYLWPAMVALGARNSARPWPECWEDHPGFVTLMMVLQRWHDDIGWGETKGDINLAAHDWLTFLRTEVVAAIVEIRKSCRDGHVDASRARPVPKAQAALQPRLPGEVPPPPPPEPPVPSAPWGGMQTGDRGIG